MADKILYANLAKSTLASGISDVAVSLAVQAGDGTKFPNPAAGEYFKIRLRDASGNYEIVHCTARSVDTLTIVRGQEGTTPRAFAGNDKVEVVVTKGTLETQPQRGATESIDGLWTFAGKHTINGTRLYASAGGTDTYTVSLAAGITSLASGDTITCYIANPNTSATPTINPNAIGAKTIKRPGGFALAAGDLAGLHTFRYDGTDFIVINPVERHPESVRQTVLAGSVDANGQANFLNAGTGLAVDMDATATPVVATFAAGEDEYGQINYRKRFSADQANYWASLAASNVSYLLLDRNTSTGAVTAYSTLVPPQYGPAFNKTKQALLHFDGSDASTTITDEHGNAWTVAGNAQIDTAQLKFGSSSLLLDGTGDYASSSDFTTLGEDRWTLEAFVRFNSLPAAGQEQVLIAAENNSGYGALLDLWNNAGTYTGYVRLSSNGTAHDIATSGASVGAISAGVWYHVALVFDGSTYRVYWDGVQKHTVVSSAKICAITKIALGRSPAGALQDFNGWMDDFRFSPCCRYPAGTAFTPTASAFSADAEWFDTSAFKWKYGSPTSWTDKQRIAVGEATTDASSVTGVTTYSIRGKYKSPLTTIPASGTAQSFSHNLGRLDARVRMTIVCRTADKGYVVGDRVELATAVDATVGGVSFGPTGRNTASAVFATGIPAVDKAAATMSNINTASWKYEMSAEVP